MDIEGDREPAVAVGHGPRPWWRRHLIGLVAVLGFVLLAGWGIGSWVSGPHAPDYSGQTRAASFDFDCSNAIFWGDPNSKYRWWAGESPTLPSDFDTSPPTAGTPPYHHSEGTLHFDTPTQATFTSKAGGQLILTREPVHQFHYTSCRIG